MLLKSIRLLALFFYLCSITSCYLTKQSENRAFSYDDSLSKYSYLIFGVKIKPDLNKYYTSKGTCFFIRKNGELYLITANHVLSGNDTSGQLNPNHPEIMEVFIRDSEFKFIKKAPIETSISNDTSCCGILKRDGDYCVIKVDPNMFSSVFSVEKFIRKPFKRICGLQFAGFTKAGLDKIEDHPTKVLATSKRLKFYADSTNYYFSSPEIQMDGSLQGTSGAPIFVKDIYSNKWRLLGLCAGALKSPSTDEGYIYAPYIDVIYNRIIKL